MGIIDIVPSPYPILRFEPVHASPILESFTNRAITTTSSLLRVANGLSDLMLFREVLHGSGRGMGTIQEWRDVLWGFPTEAKYSKGHLKHVQLAMSNLYQLVSTCIYIIRKLCQV